MLGALSRALHCLPPESAHDAAVAALEARRALCGVRQPPRVCATTAMGLEFPNPVGLAAGFDKNAAHVDALAALGFGFIEVGGITPLPQPGNPRPRIFRLPQAGALVNRMGFNNCGAKQAAENLSRREWRGVVGINLGKNAQTPLENAADDYCATLETLRARGDFFTVNVSSPNTAGLRELQSGEHLKKLLRTISQKRDSLRESVGRRIPLAVKLSPDLNDDELRAALEVAAAEGMDGAIVGNTTTTRPPEVSGLPGADEDGGLSGRPLFSRTTEMLRTAREVVPESFALIGTGGIFTASDARKKFRAGANLVQTYTGLIYEGPKMVDAILKEFASGGSH